MQHFQNVDEMTDPWRVLATTSRTQVAVMVLQEGETSGEFGTDHPQADQVLYVVSGEGKARTREQDLVIRRGDTVLIPAGEEHQIVGGPIVTFNVYGPPAYPDEA